MGVAAYNRGSRALRRTIDATSRPAAFEVMERLNALPKDPSAGQPFGPIDFVQGNGGWWATCPVTGFGFWYRDLATAVRRWRVALVSYDHGTWGADVSY